MIYHCEFKSQSSLSVSSQDTIINIIEVHGNQNRGGGGERRERRQQDEIKRVGKVLEPEGRGRGVAQSPGASAGYGRGADQPGVGHCKGHSSGVA